MQVLEVPAFVSTRTIQPRVTSMTLVKPCPSKHHYPGICIDPPSPSDEGNITAIRTAHSKPQPDVDLNRHLLPLSEGAGNNNNKDYPFTTNYDPFLGSEPSSQEEVPCKLAAQVLRYKPFPQRLKLQLLV